MRSRRVCGRRDECAGEQGVALIAALLALLLIGALGGGLVLATTIETTIAGNYRRAERARAAAESVLARALSDLAAAPDWTLVLAGTQPSSFVDGPPSGSRRLADGSVVSLDLVTSMANCRRARPCTPAELTRLTAERPWGLNNPIWRPYAYGPMSDIAAGGTADLYVLALVADDPRETDDDPLVDGGGPDASGLGVVLVRACAFGPRGARAAVQAAIVRDAVTGLRVTTWTAQTGL